MKDAFYSLVDALTSRLGPDELLVCNFAGEASDFVRFNQARVRQAGSVAQGVLSLRLIHAGRQAEAGLTMTGCADDLMHAQHAVASLRETLQQLPQDPWLVLPGEPHSTETQRRGTLPEREAIVHHVATAARDLDFVGFYAGGTLYRGHANALGQRNWHEVDSFNLDWSVYRNSDKAVKAGYAGFDWDAGAFDSRLQRAATDLDLLTLPARTLDPGEYRAYLAPEAVNEIMGLLSWNAFSSQAQETRQSALLRMQHGETLSPRVTLSENTAGGIGEPFQHDGYAKPPCVTLIDEGRLHDALVSPRSAKQYGRTANGANSRESPESLDMAAGALLQRDALQALDTGLYVNNLWYLNYSDRAAARVTGMTRFATFWVEHGRIVAPVNVMRFDDTLYRVLGTQLAALTAEREFIPSASTYESRSTASSRLPGVLLSALRLTL